MKTATQDLEYDHVYILRLIDVMEQMIMNFSTDIGHLESVVYLIRNYADGFHHAKEENLLFPLMVTKGFSNDQSPVSVMLHDHEEGRNFVKSMSDGIDKFKEGDSSELPEVYRNMQSYIDLIRAHIEKENNVLFKMADRVLSTTEQAELLNEFSVVKMKSYGNGRIKQFILEIEGLELIYKG